MRLIFSFALVAVLLPPHTETRDQYNYISTTNRYKYDSIWKFRTYNLDTVEDSEVDSCAKTTEESFPLAARERRHTKTVRALDMSFGSPEALSEAGNSRRNAEVRSKMTRRDLRSVGNDWSVAVPQEDKNTVKQRIGPRSNNPNGDTPRSKSLKQSFERLDL